ncbi:MAG: DoxX family protein [Bacteroidaceae bacterium]|nr:DoxX family protein [Bacteroidaceae bacterium]
MYKEKFLKFLFHEPEASSTKSVVILLARIIFGFLFLNHGIAKWDGFIDISNTFPDPLGLGGTLSMWLVLFAEIICSLGFIIGALYRLCLIPMIFTICVAFFVIHANDPLAAKEPSLMYLTIFALLYITGPGKYSIDAILKNIYYRM